MKRLLNWRYYVLAALFAVCYTTVMLIFGVDERPFGQWLALRLCLAAVAWITGTSLGRLHRQWSRQGKVEPFSGSSYGNSGM